MLSTYSHKYILTYLHTVQYQAVPVSTYILSRQLVCWYLLLVQRVVLAGHTPAQATGHSAARNRPTRCNNARLSASPPARQPACPAPRRPLLLLLLLPLLLLLLHPAPFPARQHHDCRSDKHPRPHRSSPSATPRQQARREAAMTATL